MDHTRLPMEEEVVLVDAHDVSIGTLGKLAAHQTGALHRAFSVFLFDTSGRLLMQQRARTKYHSGGLWTNTCCGHPRPQEPTLLAAQRRLMEEMGIDAMLEEQFSFVYKASFDNGLHEHEFDHVYFGIWTGTVTPALSEVEDHRYIAMDELGTAMRERPEHYSAWLIACWPRLIDAHLSWMKGIAHHRDHP